MADDDLLEKGLTGAVLREQAHDTGWYAGYGRIGLPKYGLAWILSGAIVKAIRSLSRRLHRLQA